MSLFLRAGRLLSLSGGFRGCCCRPENPPEPPYPPTNPGQCDCPGFCRYFFSYAGNGSYPAISGPSLGCDTDRRGEQEQRFSSPVFGVVSGGYSYVKLSPPVCEESFEGEEILKSGFRGTFGTDPIEGKFLGFNLSRDVFGGATAEYKQRFVDAGTWAAEDGLGALMVAQANVLFGCGNRNFAVSVSRSVSVRSAFAFCQPPIQGANEIGGTESAIFDIPSQYITCDRNAAWDCPYDTQAIVGHHLNQDVTISWDDTGVSLNGTFMATWQKSNFYPEGDWWRVPGQFPISDSVELKVRQSCYTGPCDGDLSLAGLPVSFEGKTFVYGDGEEFTSDDGLTKWVESLPGIFTRYDYDPCDPTQFFAASTITAEVFSTTVDGQDYWAVTLQRQCAERSACQPATDSERTTTWSGVFSCSSAGFPTGAPQSAADSAQPPDLDSDVISGGTPSGSCVNLPTTPSFVFL